MGTHPIFESDFDCLTDKMAKGKKGKNEDEEFDRIEAEMAKKKAAQAVPNPSSVSDFPTMEEPKKKGKKGKKKGFLADLEDELENPELVKELEAAEIEPVLSKSQLKKTEKKPKETSGCGHQQYVGRRRTRRSGRKTGTHTRTQSETTKESGEEGKERETILCRYASLGRRGRSGRRTS